MSGFYRSEDFGRTWHMSDQIRTSSKPVAPVFHPTDPTVIYICDSVERFGQQKITTGWRVLRSNNRGRSWTVCYEYDYGQWTGIQVSALLLDPARPERLWLTLTGNRPASAMLSENGGISWAAIGAGLPAGAPRLFLDPYSPVDARVLYADVGGKAFVSRDGGKTFAGFAVNGVGVQGKVVGLYGLAGGPQFTLFVLGEPRQNAGVSAGAILSSTDGGTTWTDLSKNLAAVAGTKGRIVKTESVACTAHPSTVYVCADLRNGAGDYWDGVFTSADGGGTWTYSFPGPNILTLWRKQFDQWDVRFYSPDWITRELKWGWGGSTLGAGEGGRVLRTDMGRLVGTDDGGKTWRQLFSDERGHDCWSSRGLEVTTCYRVVFDPHDVTRQWITYTDIGCFRSNDGGVSWRRSVKGLKFTNTMYEIQPDPDIPGRLYGVCSDTHDLPGWKGISVDPDSFTGGFCISDDGGSTWTMKGEGLPNSACCALELDPSSPKEARTLYLVAFGRGVYKSVDSGGHWVRKVKGMEPCLEKNPNLWMISRGKDGVLYAAVTKRVRVDTGKLDSRGGALFRSDDNAESWQRIGPQTPEALSGTPNDFSCIWDVRASPHTPNEVSVACQIDVHSGTSAVGGIYRSMDKGRTWARIFDNPMCQRVDYNPVNPAQMFCGTARDGLFRSRDGGKCWNKVDGVPFGNVYRTSVDLRRPDTLWVTTFGGGVWKGPAEGGFIYSLK